MAGRSSIVTIVDYGVGNLLSATRAFEHVGSTVVLATTPEQIAAADRLVLPGVGAFGNCMSQLEERKLRDPVKAFAVSGKPMLGICVGMQMLFEVSEEFGEHSGLGLLPGRVVAIPRHDTEARPLRVPHIGWAPLMAGAGFSESRFPVLAHDQLGKEAYFVHSFAARPEQDRDIMLQVSFGGHALVAAVAKDNVMGVQFHPEKSGPVGLDIIRCFAGLQG